MVARIVNDAPEGPGIDPDAAVRGAGKKPIKGWMVIVPAFAMGVLVLAVAGKPITLSLWHFLIGAGHSEPAQTPVKTGQNINVGVPAVKPEPAAAPAVAAEAPEQPPKEDAPDDVEDDHADGQQGGWGAPTSYAPSERTASVADGQEQPAPRPRYGFATNVVSGGKPVKWGVDATRPRIWVGCSLRPTDMVQAYVVSNVNSQIPGLIIAVTNQPHYSMDDPRVELLPRGTRLLGVYGGEEGGGDTLYTRLPFKLLAAQFPPGDRRQSLDFTDANIVAMAADASMGVPGKAKQRWGRLILATILETFLNAGSRMATPADAGYLVDLQGEAADQSRSILGGAVRRQLDTRAEVAFPPGTPVTFSPYQPVKVSSRCLG